MFHSLINTVKHFNYHSVVIQVGWNSYLGIKGDVLTSFSVLSLYHDMLYLNI